MCLYIDNMRKKPTKPFTAYKVLLLVDGRIRTPHRETLVKEGKFVAIGVLNKNIDDVREGAIHLYENRKSAEDNCCSNDAFIMEITVFPKDFLYWGNDDDLCVKQLIFPKGCFNTVPQIIELGIMMRSLNKIKEQMLSMENSFKVLLGNIS